MPALAFRRVSALVVALAVTLGTTAARHVAPFAWPGVYDAVGTGFPNGDRVAVLTVTRPDSVLALAVDGPPGHLVRARFAGDSADALWDFGDGTEPMLLRLRGADDSLWGVWQIGDQTGAVRGSRRQ